MFNKIRSKSKAITLAVLLSLGSAGSIAATSDYFEISKQLDIFVSLFKELHTFYVDEINTAKLMRTGIDAMLKSLDPYTVYYSESEIEDYRVMTTGEYGGVGAVIGKRGPHIQIIEPYEGYPAFKSDIRAGDILLEVDGKDVSDKNTGEISQLLKGEPGSEVKLTIKRPGEEKSLEKSVERKEIQLPNVPYFGMLENNIGYIVFSNFRSDASEEVKSALKSLMKENELKGLVLDLRGNPGGILNEAVKTVNCFVPKDQLVVSTKGKVEEWDKEYRTYEKPVTLDLPLAVLIDERSASASEIVSGSLQDLDRAVVVGQQSFGKGLVQQARDLPFNAKVKLTIAKYYTPSGRCIQAIDYAERDDEGKAKRLPDSLRKEFQTAGGRTVLDGAGIDPDILIPDEEYPPVLRSLISKQHIFDYATQYRNSHDSISDPRNFDINDALYSEFTAFLIDKDYTYKTETEKKIEALKKSAEEEKYLNALKEELAELEKDLQTNKSNDIKVFRDKIEPVLEEEIVGRYYYQKGRIKASLDDDPVILKAIEVLNDREAYNKILKP